MGRLSTHVLDTSAGQPGAGVRVVLRRDDEVLADTRTNADGRTDKPLLEGAAFQAGSYELTFHVGDYFRARGHRRSPIRRSSTSFRSAFPSPRTRTTTCRCWSRRSAIRPTGEAEPWTSFSANG